MEYIPPCKECLIFIICKNKLNEINHTLNCEILYNWYINSINHFSELDDIISEIFDKDFIFMRGSKNICDLMVGKYKHKLQ